VGSNHRPLRYKCSALPTELRQRPEPAVGVEPTQSCLRGKDRPHGDTGMHEGAGLTLSGETGGGRACRCPVLLHFSVLWKRIAELNGAL
jgi:hypothetical protein